MDKIDWKREYLLLMNTLPVGTFIMPGCTEVDYSRIDASEFKDNCGAFTDAMEMARSVELRMERE